MCDTDDTKLATLGVAGRDWWSVLTLLQDVEKAHTWSGPAVAIPSQQNDDTLPGERGCQDVAA